MTRETWIAACRYFWFGCFFMLLFSNQAHAAYAVIDAESGRLLEEQQAHTSLPPASITKIWTVFVALQEAEGDEAVQISQHASNQEGSSVYLEAKETWSLESLLYATMLQSGNDAAVAVAEHVAGSEEAFAGLMNDYAREAGVSSTWFQNPSGLHEDGHYVSAYDMALLFKIAMQDPRFRVIASAKQFRPQERNTLWVNKHRLVTNDQALAGKTGYTLAAGRTLISYFEQPPKKIVVVSLNERNDWKLHEHLRDTTFDEVIHETVEGEYVTSDGIKLKVSKPFAYLRKSDEILTHVVRLQNKQTTGEWTIQLGETTLSFPITYSME